MHCVINIMHYSIWASAVFYLLLLKSIGTAIDSIDAYLSQERIHWWQIDDPSHISSHILFVRPVNLDEGNIHSCYQYKVGKH